MPFDLIQLLLRETGDVVRITDNSFAYLHTNVKECVATSRCCCYSFIADSSAAVAPVFGCGPQHSGCSPLSSPGCPHRPSRVLQSGHGQVITSKYANLLRSYFFIQCFECMRVVLSSVFISSIPDSKLLSLPFQT